MHILFCMCLVNIVGVVCSHFIYKRLQLCGGNFILLKEGTQYLLEMEANDIRRGRI